jgi:putative DNA primase/helicase
MMNELQTSLEEKVLSSLGESPPYLTDSKWIRWGGKSNKYWLRYQFIELSGGSVISYACGNWADDTSFKGRIPEDSALSSEDLKKLRIKQRENEAAFLKEQVERQARAAIEADAKWSSLKVEFDSHPYMKDKCITQKFGSRISSHNEPNVPINLYIPLKDEAGKIWNLQSISPSGSKLFLTGRKKGLFHILKGDLIGSKLILLGEGWATCAAIVQCIDQDATVVCAFDCGNLIHVAGVIRKQNPNATLLICADKDPNGIGELKAKEAAEKHSGTILVPKFTLLKEGAK